MQVAVSEELLRGVNLTPREALVDFAVGIYSEGKVTLGRAARIAKMTVSEFQRLLGERCIPMHYDIHDLERDLLVVRERADDHSQ
jgi:predicted HTH domain antitoxin